MRQALVIIAMLLFMSFSIHKGKFFSGWNKDTKNGFHVAVGFAVVITLVSVVLNHFAPLG